MSTKYDCLGENKLPWFYDLERGLDKNVRTYSFIQDDNERVAILMNDRVLAHADIGFKSSNERIQRLVDNHLFELLREDCLV